MLKTVQRINKDYEDKEFEDIMDMDLSKNPKKSN